MYNSLHVRLSVVVMLGVPELLQLPKKHWTALVRTGNVIRRVSRKSAGVADNITCETLNIVSALEFPSPALKNQLLECLRDHVRDMRLRYKGFQLSTECGDSLARALGMPEQSPDLLLLRVDTLAEASGILKKPLDHLFLLVDILAKALGIIEKCLELLLLRVDRIVTLVALVAHGAHVRRCVSDSALTQTP